MDLGLQDRVVIVAASSKGLGRASARQFLLEGAKVTINGRDQASLDRTAKDLADETGGDVIAIAGDMRSATDIDRLVSETVARRGGLDAIVCNAGGPPPGTFEDFPDDAPWEDAITLNLMSTLRLIRAALPHLLESRGSVTAIVSTSIRQPIPGLILSNTARSAVNGLMKSLALEYASRGVRFNNVLPGSTRTDRILGIAEKEAAKTGRPIDEILAARAKEIPMGRIAEPSEFANAVVFMASPAASYITGQSLAVDGGMIRGI